MLCGGAGTRLWPLSRKSFPKQFVPLIDEKSLLQLTLERVILISSRVICATSEEHRFLVAQAMAAVNLDGKLLLEPVARNTAAAMACAALCVETEELLLFCPADHHIPDVVDFVNTLKRGIPAARSGAIVTMGISPSFPSNAFGYITQGSERQDGTFSVDSFTEKPSTEQAQALIDSRTTFWNAGIFLCTAKTLIKALREHAPDIMKKCELAMTFGKTDGAFVRPQIDAYTACRSESIDYAVMEHHSNIAVLPFRSTWSDIGSWKALAAMASVDERGNSKKGLSFCIDSENTHVHASGRLIVTLGTSDIQIVDTPDATLVVSNSHTEKVKDLVNFLEENQIPEAKKHRKVYRPWGYYDSIDIGPRHHVKRITVLPERKLSLQKHFRRAEHWVVVQGCARVTRGSEEFLLQENESIFIPKETIHRLENIGTENLEIIEVQSGEYFGEDDIVRFSDDYGR